MDKRADTPNMASDTKRTVADLSVAFEENLQQLDHLWSREILQHSP